LTTPAVPGEVVVLYANGFGATSTPVVSGSNTQSGTLPTLPVITDRRCRGGRTVCRTGFARLVSVQRGDSAWHSERRQRAYVATYNGVEAAPAALITVQGSAPSPTSVTYYVAPNGNDFWSGTLPAPNSANTDGPFASFDHARAFVQSIVKAGLTQVNVAVPRGHVLPSRNRNVHRGRLGLGVYADCVPELSWRIAAISGGVRVQNWTNTGGNTWKTTLPASTQYFENLFYNGVRRLRPRLGGSLGTYFRYVGPVYLNAPGPAGENAGCELFGLFPG
jgi:hypothetical protein